MTDTAHAVLFALNSMSLPQNPAVIVMGDAPPAIYSTAFPDARFITPFAGCANAWTRLGHSAHTPPDKAHIVIAHISQQTIAAHAMLADAISLAVEGGLVIAVAENLAGGKTLTKRFESFGCAVTDISKHKCRVVWTSVPQAAQQETLQQSQTAGAIQPRDGDGLLTQAGVFSWDKQDRGTRILLETIASIPLQGAGADFGCGIGDIARVILRDYPHITHLTCIDHDARAIPCCTQNLSGFLGRFQCVWQDVLYQTRLTGLDFIVMNPPFHTGKSENKDLGQGFIKKAAECLKPKGILLMVANTHLPYEEPLKLLFSTVETINRADGFKVIKAVR